MAAAVLATSGAQGNPLEFATLATLAILAMALFRARRSRFGVLAPFPLFALGMVLYILPMAITLLVSGVLTDERAIADSQLVQAVWVSSVALAALAMGYVGGLALFPQRPQADTADHWDDPATSAVAATAGLVGGAGVLYFVLAVAGVGALASSSYGNRYLLMQGQGVLISGLNVLVVASLILHLSGLKAGDRWRTVVVPLATLALLIAWTGLIGARSVLVQFVLAWLVLRHVSGHKVHMIWVGALGVMLMVVGTLYSALGRGASVAWSVVVSLALFRFNPANTEFGSAVGTIADIVTAVPHSVPFQDGRTYLSVIGSLVPGALWPDRPLGPSVWYAAKFYPDVASQGGAFAFSPVAEAYLNFGLAGVVGCFALIGAVVAFVERWIGRRQTLPGWSALMYAGGAPWLLLFSRLDAASFVKGYLVVTLGPVIAIRVGSFLLRGANRRDAST